jgi:hypothetical protein
MSVVAEGLWNEYLKFRIGAGYRDGKEKLLEDNQTSSCSITVIYTKI